MKKLFTLLPLAALLTFSACSEEEEQPCDPAQEEALARREAELDKREADLLARERALGMNGRNNASSGDANYSANRNDNNQGTAPAYVDARTKNTRTTGRSAAPSPPQDARAAYRKARYFPGQYPEASERTLTAADLEHQSSWGKKVMMNEIYARYGLIFAEADLKKHFEGESWYKGTKKSVDGKLTPVERQNIALIRASM